MSLNIANQDILGPGHVKEHTASAQIPTSFQCISEWVEDSINIK